MTGIGKRNGGFTLTELLVVAAVITILGLSAVFNIVARAPYHRMDNARLQLISDLRAARQSAVTRSAPVYLSFNESGKSYTIWVDADRDGAVDTGEQTSETLPDYSGLTMAVSATRGYFTAMGTWSCTEGVGEVKLTLSPVGSQTIYITPSGEVNSDV